MTFDVRVRALATGGKVSCDGQTLDVNGADAVTLLIAAGTRYARLLPIPVAASATKTPPRSIVVPTSSMPPRPKPGWSSTP
jgi:hypothetical protein